MPSPTAPDTKAAAVAARPARLVDGSRRFLLMAACTGFLLPARSFGQATGGTRPSITFTGGERFVQSDYGRWLEAIYTEAFRRLGMDFQVIGYPSQRAINMADNGAVDGQLERGHDFDLEHPNLVRVEEATNTEAYTAYATKPGLSLNGWADLRKHSYTIVLRRGVGKSAESLADYAEKSRLVFVDRPEQGLMMLMLGRTDLYIDYTPLVNETLKALRQSEERERMRNVYVAGIMARTTHHAFLHKRHAQLAPSLAQTLRDMKREGLFEKYRAQLNSSAH